MAILFAEALVHVPYVTSVNICDNNLTDRGLSAIVHSIVHMHDVCRLDMSFNTIGSDAASALAHYLSSSTCGLSELILQKADVDDDECGNFVTALHQNKSLRLLDLSENKVGSNENLNTVMPDIVTGGEALAELLRSSDCPLTTLKLGETVQPYSEDIGPNESHVARLELDSAGRSGGSVQFSEQERLHY